MQKYLKPYVAHFAVGMVVMSISGFLTLVITRLWGQLGGVGASGSTGNALLGMEMDDLASVGWTLLGALAIQSFFSFVRVLLFADMTEKMMLPCGKTRLMRWSACPWRFTTPVASAT